MPTVSVIIPTYNRALMVKEAIESALTQTYPDYEIIVIDDGSTDGTKKVVSTFANKIRYVFQAHKGRSCARNHGIRLAKGRYIAFLDSDDLFLPGKLSTQVSALENNPDFGMAYSYFLKMDGKGTISESVSFMKEKLTGWIYPELLFTKGVFIVTPSVMVRADILNEVGVFDENMHICEDLDLWRRIARYYKVLLIKKSLVIVRYRNMEQSAIPEKLHARIFYYKKSIFEDPNLKKLKSRLFLDMYLHHGREAISCFLQRSLSPMCYDKIRFLYRKFVN